MIDRILSVKTRSWEWFKTRAEGPHALFWLAVLAFLEPTFSPIVPETLMVAILLANSSRWVYYATVTTVASVAGGIFGYFLGAALFKTIGQFILDFYSLGPWMEKAHQLFSENVFTTMAIVTSTPVPDKIFVFVAGFLHIHFGLYLAGYIVGRAARIFTVAWLLKRYGAKMLDLADRYAWWVALVFMLLLGLFILDAFEVVSLTRALH